MIKLTDAQIEAKLEWMDNYVNAKNAATGSTLDANANVSMKNIATMDAEFSKDFKIQINREMIKRKIREEFGDDLAKQYIRDVQSHLIYVHDETSLSPYCVSINMYPFLTEGMMGIGGDSGKPNHLTSFCGNFINLVFAIASQFAGAVATVEFLMYFDHFARKDYGDNYLETNYDLIMQQMQGVVYALNQPAAARGYQSVFWNISTFDEFFFDGMFSDFAFPDFSKPSWESLDKLQQEFHKWFRQERTKKLLTFPVVTHAAISNDEGTDWKDLESADFIADEMSKGGEFFIYTSKTADSLASCCRVRNEVDDNTFSYSLGAGGVATGSKNVITINMNRLTQEGHSLTELISRIHKYQVAFDKHFKEWQANGLLPVYDAGFISLDKQYLTIGLNGVVEAAEYLGYEISNNDEYKTWLTETLSTFKTMNKEAKEQYGLMFNTEVVPAENLGVKNAKWDRADGLIVPRDCYNSYFYIVEDNGNLIDNMILHGGEIVGSLDGGQAHHRNHDRRLKFPQYRSLLRSLVITGNNYFCENVPKTCCNECDTITADNLKCCPNCNSSNVDYAARVIGYLKRVRSYSHDRQIEHSDRAYNGEINYDQILDIGRNL